VAALSGRQRFTAVSCRRASAWAGFPGFWCRKADDRNIVCSMHPMTSPAITDPLEVIRSEAAVLTFHPRGTHRCVGAPVFRSQLARDLTCLLDLRSWSGRPTERRSPRIRTCRGRWPRNGASFSWRRARRAFRSGSGPQRTQSFKSAPGTAHAYRCRRESLPGFGGIARTGGILRHGVADDQRFRSAQGQADRHGDRHRLFQSRRRSTISRRRRNSWTRRDLLRIRPRRGPSPAMQMIGDAR
jgi:hypothetical protein